MVDVRSVIFPKHKKRLTYSLCVLYLLVAGGRIACADEQRGGTLSLYFENDCFGGTDRYYTNGMQVSWCSPELSSYSHSALGGPFLKLLEAMPFGNSPGFEKNALLSIGQNIYTPDDTKSVSLVEGDRPYAGWLYAGLGMAWKNAGVRNTLMLNLGVVGSFSQAKEVQKLVHEARGQNAPKGWDNQLRNELGVVAVYQRTWRWPKNASRVGLNWDVLPNVGIGVGNVRTYAGAGAEVRCGINLPDDFGSGPIGPAEATPTSLQGNQRARRASHFDIGAYVFGRADGKIVAHNIFLDGNTFAKSASVDRKIMVADLSVGAAVNYKNTSLTYALIYRTKEFTSQRGEGQTIGSISLNIQY